MALAATVRSKAHRWNQIARTAWELYRGEGVAGVAATVPAFLTASAFNSYFRTTRGQEAFLDSADLRTAEVRTSPIHEYDDAETVTIAPPVRSNFDSGWATHDESFDASYVVELRDVTLVGPDAVRLLSNGLVLTEDPYEAMGDARVYTAVVRMLKQQGPAAVPQLRTMLDPSRIEPAAVEPGPVLSLVGFPMSFYHWVVELLPRLRFLDRYRSETGRDPELLVPPDPPQYVAETLKLLGHDVTDCRTWDNNVRRFERFVYPSNTRNPQGIPHPAACRWLREKLGGAAGDPAGATPNRVYVSREDAGARRVTNEAALLSVLDDYGFEKVLLSQLDVREQVRLFREAEAVVGPHGAGLVNLVYGIDIDVVELFGANVQEHYYHLSNLLGHDYHCLSCRPRGRVDLEIDPAEVDALLADILEEL